MKRLPLTLLYAITCLAWMFSFQVMANSFDKSLNSGQVRIHYPTLAQTSCSAIFIGVGTAMGIKGYDKLSSRIAQYGHIVAILDHAPGNLMKTDANRYRNLAQDIKDQLTQWLPANSCQNITHWVMGGHSAGGQAAQNAVANTPGLADGIFSIDPYNAKDTNEVNVPAMYWGFSKTTCFVDVNDAAKGTYQRSNDRRAFYKVNTKYSWGPCGYSPKYFHCSFCDGHCPACTNCRTTPDHFFDDVAKSANLFIQHGLSSTWNKSSLTFSATTPYTLYVDSDQP